MSLFNFSFVRTNTEPPLYRWEQLDHSAYQCFKTTQSPACRVSIGRGNASITPRQFVSTLGKESKLPTSTKLSPSCVSYDANRYKFKHSIFTTTYIIEFVPPPRFMYRHSISLSSCSTSISSVFNITFQYTLYMLRKIICHISKNPLTCYHKIACNTPSRLPNNATKQSGRPQDAVR